MLMITSYQDLMCTLIVFMTIAGWVFTEYTSEMIARGASPEQANYTFHPLSNWHTHTHISVFHRNNALPLHENATWSAWIHKLLKES